MWIKLHVAPDDVWEDAYTASCGLRHKWDFGAGNPNDNTARSKKVRGCEKWRNGTRFDQCMNKHPSCPGPQGR